MSRLPFDRMMQSITACWDWSQFWCEPCSVSMDKLRDLCNDQYPDCKGTCDGEAG